MLTQNPGEMSSYSSLYPGIDHLPNRLPHLDRYGHPWCIVCHGRNGRAVAGDGLCDTCRGFNHGNPEHRRIAYGHGLEACECHRCGQRLAVPPAAPRVCDPCRSRAREPQGEAMRLFAPAPNQIPGQLAL